jgi:hypothetical protein
MFQQPEAPPPDPFADLRATEGRPGRLLLVGCSEAFKNDRMQDLTYRSDHLLLRAVADLALRPELAAVAGRQRAVQGFGYVAPGRRIWWRAFAVGTFPLVLLAIAALRGRRRPAGRGRA